MCVHVGYARASHASNARRRSTLPSAADSSVSLACSPGSSAREPCPLTAMVSAPSKARSVASPCSSPRRRSQSTARPPPDRPPKQVTVAVRASSWSAAGAAVAGRGAAHARRAGRQRGRRGPAAPASPPLRAASSRTVPGEHGHAARGERAHALGGHVRVRGARPLVRPERVGLRGRRRGPREGGHRQLHHRRGAGRHVAVAAERRSARVRESRRHASAHARRVRAPGHVSPWRRGPLEVELAPRPVRRARDAREEDAPAVRGELEHLPGAVGARRVAEGRGGPHEAVARARARGVDQVDRPLEGEPAARRLGALVARGDEQPGVRELEHGVQHAAAPPALRPRPDRLAARADDGEEAHRADALAHHRGAAGERAARERRAVHRVHVVHLARVAGVRAHGPRRPEGLDGEVVVVRARARAQEAEGGERHREAARGSGRHPARATRRRPRPPGFSAAVVVIGAAGSPSSFRS